MRFVPQVTTLAQARVKASQVIIQVLPGSRMSQLRRVSDLQGIDTILRGNGGERTHGEVESNRWWATTTAGLC